MSWTDFSAAIALFASRNHDLGQVFQMPGHFEDDAYHVGEIAALGVPSLANFTSNFFRKSDDGAVLEGLISMMAALEASAPHDITYAVLWLAHDAQPDASSLGAMSHENLLQTPQGSPTLLAVSSDENMSDHYGEFSTGSSSVIQFHTPYLQKSTASNFAPHILPKGVQQAPSPAPIELFSSNHKDRAPPSSHPRPPPPPPLLAAQLPNPICATPSGISSATQNPSRSIILKQSSKYAGTSSNSP